MDGTFKSCPRPYTQVLAIHGLFHGRCLPLVMAIMTERTIAAYRQIFKHAKAKYGSDRTIGAASRAAGRDTPTYVFPEEVRWVIRARFAEDPIRLKDGRVEQQGAVYQIDVVDLATTRWPSCRCGAVGSEGASGGPVRRV
ncbi:Hypp6243 [Branchiostoma lanceolatum]|uniref:Hypp6243 protein n=1 Tax=Branchiostoma lanceolatum TaxID=7740 RepID=A0A8J9W904_BRALA|nr:Hypp6243 [Branchiostoma lanceolatum]